MADKNKIMRPEEIEKMSFEIIDREAGKHNFNPQEWEIVRRIIHTSADFEYMKTVRFHADAIHNGIDAIRSGKTVIIDTNMAKAGVRNQFLKRFGGDIICLIDDHDVKIRALAAGTTRAREAVDEAISIIKDGIYVIGNAPTALLRLMELMEEGKAEPALVVGFPVGFVNATESKALLVKKNRPYITNIGRKGGSTIAASIVNSLIKMAQ